MAGAGRRVGLMDTDIYGPNIPRRDDVTLLAAAGIDPRMEDIFGLFGQIPDVLEDVATL